MGRRIAIVGRGAVGTALARALRAAGADVRVVRGRTAGARTATALHDVSLVVLAVPDAEIAAVGARLAEHVPRGASVVHCAGARDAEELAALRRHGLHVGAMHPLVSFAARTRPPSLASTTFVVSGDPRAVSAAKRLARLVGARSLVAPLHGPLYHAAAALTANGAVALAHAGVALLEAKGASHRDAQRAIAGLLRTVAANVETVGVPDALTGPIARGDATTVARHRAAIGTASPSTLATYDATARAILACALDRGLRRDAATAIASLLDASPSRDAALTPRRRAPRPSTRARRPSR